MRLTNKNSKWDKKINITLTVRKLQIIRDCVSKITF